MPARWTHLDEVEDAVAGAGRLEDERDVGDVAGLLADELLLAAEAADVDVEDDVVRVARRRDALDGAGAQRPAALHRAARVVCERERGDRQASRAALHDNHEASLRHSAGKLHELHYTSTTGRVVLTYHHLYS